MNAPAILLAIVLQTPTYWQQHLKYDITATLDEPRGTLGGTQRVEYQNNSPDTLHTVSFHLYLNAFRPGSRWSDADSLEHRRRFNDLKDPDFAYNRVSDVLVDGTPVRPTYPFAPDSTIVRYTLPNAVAPGGGFTVSMHWEARPSTTPRRQGRRGRAFDFAQWYPRVVAYDKYGWEEHPLYPAGEFYGDFGDFQVTLDVPEDQVVGATGVPVCGDPGWERANQNPSRPVEYQRNPRTLSIAFSRRDDQACDQPHSTGRKQIIWIAKDVHHFAMSMNPAYKYEGGHVGGVAVHVLYQPGDEKTWGGGVAVHNTEKALQWLDELFGPFPWPQITNVHRIEGGGTEFPMMVHDGSADLDLIVHEVGHNYLMGILASNEWKEGFLDEGFTSFQNSWYDEIHGVPNVYQANERSVLLSDVDGWSQPTSLVSEQYRDFGTYNAMIYDRGELFFQQLRTLVGDSTMRRILRTYYERWQLRHVDEASFRAVAEEVSKQDLSQFFAQFLHGTDLYDYTLGRISTRRTGGSPSQWTTRVEVVRKASGMFPVDVVVRSKTDSAVVRATGTADREWVVLTTREKPREVEVDPRARAHDWNMLNNRKTRGLLGWGRDPREHLYLDRIFSQPTRRDRLTVGLLPTVWYNDFSGVVVGGRVRTDYLGRFQQGELSYTLDTRRTRDNENYKGIGLYARLRNPAWLQSPRTTQSFEAYRVEGRAGLAASAERQTNRHRGFGAQTYVGTGVRWMVTTDTDYLNSALWDAGGTVEATAWIRTSERHGAWNLAGRLSLDGGVEYRNRGAGFTTENSYDAQPYGRLTGEASARRWFGRFGVALRTYGGWVESGLRPLKQRQIFLAGADPYQQFANPFLRSRGAPLDGADVHYLMPGGGGVRGLAAGTTATGLIAVNGDVERSVLSLSKTRLFRDIRVAAFGDAALANGDVPRLGSTRASLVTDAGVGLRMSHCIGQTSFVTSFDLPAIVSRPRLAVNERAQVFAFRWVVSATGGFVSGDRPTPGSRSASSCR
jgi:hypothetical protein